MGERREGPISRANEGGREQEKEWRERSSVSISLRTLEFASNICPPTTNATAMEGKGNGCGRGRKLAGEEEVSVSERRR